MNARFCTITYSNPSSYFIPQSKTSYEQCFSNCQNPVSFCLNTFSLWREDSTRLLSVQGHVIVSYRRFFSIKPTNEVNRECRERKGREGNEKSARQNDCRRRIYYLELRDCEGTYDTGKIKGCEISGFAWKYEIGYAAYEFNVNTFNNDVLLYKKKILWWLIFKKWSLKNALLVYFSI